MRDMIIRSGNTHLRSCGYLHLMTCFALLGLLTAAAAAVDCSLVNVSPIAKFEYSVVPAESGSISVNFYSTSLGGRVGSGPVSDPIESYHWTYGDGSSSEKSNPLHKYASGSARFPDADKPYPVTLTVKTGCGRYASTTKNVSVYCLNQTANFTILRPEGDGPYAAPVAFSIRDTSLHVADSVTAWHYTVWDAGMTRLFLESTEKDPTFIIRNGGRYVIRQEIFKTCSSIPPPGTEVTRSVEVTGSAASDAIPMETIPVMTPAPAIPATNGSAAIPASPVSRTTAPAPLSSAASPGYGTLSVATSPAGALVFIDDVLYELSPVSITDLTAGPHTLRLEKSGYRKKSVTVDIADGQVTDYATSLEAESSGLGIVPVIAVVLVIGAAAGAAYRYLKRKKPKKPAVDWNNP